MVVALGMALFFSRRLKAKLHRQSDHPKLWSLVRGDEYARSDFIGAAIGWGGLALGILLYFSKFFCV